MFAYTQTQVDIKTVTYCEVALCLQCALVHWEPEPNTYAFWAQTQERIYKYKPTAAAAHTPGTVSHEIEKRLWLHQ